jgi:hypothetical protein
MEYFRRRAAQERVAAMKAADSRVREAHLEMARLYAARVGETVVEEQSAAFDMPTVA